MYPPKTAALFIDLALTEVGYTEGPADNETKYQKTNQPWCGAFINWVAKAADVSIPNCVSTLAGAQAFQARAQYHPSAKAMPRRGDLAFFDFPNDSLERISHIGLVIGHNHETKICSCCHLCHHLRHFPCEYRGKCGPCLGGAHLFPRLLYCS